MAGIVQRIKSWFSKEETRMLDYDESHAEFTDHQHMNDEAKPHMEDRINKSDD